MNRVLISTPATISESWYQGTTIQDPGAVTVTVKSDDGTTIATGAAGGTGAAPRTFQLTATHTAQLDRLTVSWASGTLGTLTTIVEVAGDFLFTINDARAAGLAAVDFDDDQVAATRVRVEQALEDTCGLAFVPRYDRAVIFPRGMWLRVGRPYLRRVRWASTLVGGITTTLAPSSITALQINPSGFIGGYAWPYRYGTVTIGYEHGMDRPPEPVKAAALEYARFLLTQDQSIDSRAERLVTDDGTLIFGGGATGIPAVDRIIDAYRVPVIA
jgi:hypothetical protein